MTLPDFLILGAAKSGTTALYRLLREHPQVFMPEFKEPFFFSKYKPSPSSIRSLDAYRRLFDEAPNGTRVGEASAGYLYCPEAPARIRETLGVDLRLVAILRQPVDRAYSMYWHRRRDGEEPLTFVEAVRAEPERIEAGWQLGWHYLAMGHYRPQLERFLAAFGRESLLVLNHDDLDRAPDRIGQALADHLDLAPFADTSATRTANAGYTVRHAGVERLVRTLGGDALGGLRKLAPAPLRHAAKRGLRRLNRSSSGYPPLDPDLRRELFEGFRQDVEYLADRFGAGFERWLEP